MIRTQKWVFDGQTRPYENLEFKDQFGLIWEGRKETVEREREEQRGRREEEEGEPSQRYGYLDFGMETHLDYGF